MAAQTFDEHTHEALIDAAQSAADEIALLAGEPASRPFYAAIDALRALPPEKAYAAYSALISAYNPPRWMAD